MADSGQQIVKEVTALPGTSKRTMPSHCTSSSFTLGNLNSIANEQYNTFLSAVSNPDPLELSLLKQEIGQDNLLREILAEYFGGVPASEDATAPEGATSSDETKEILECNKRYMTANLYLQGMIERLEQQNISILRGGEFDTTWKDYIAFLFRPDENNMEKVIPFVIPVKSSLKRIITPKEALDKTSKAIEKAIGDINPQRVRNLLE